MREYRFMQVDVFTDRPFGGNPLAVFPDASGLSADEMLSLTREMNLSESTFVLPATTARADFRVRIFTPAEEVPFAGHPVVGTHWVLARLGRVPLREPVTTVSFELGVGILPADLQVCDGKVDRVIMTQATPEFGPVLGDPSALASALGLSTDSVLSASLPVQVVSTGLPQLMVPVRSLRDVQALSVSRFDYAAIEKCCRELGTKDMLVFSFETVSPQATVHVRMFAPLHGVLEDPATGSANGALGAYLVHHGAVPLMDRTVRIVSEQGLEMHRPSTLFVEVDHDAGHVLAVRVGGQVVPVAEGAVRF